MSQLIYSGTSEQFGRAMDEAREQGRRSRDVEVERLVEALREACNCLAQHDDFAAEQCGALLREYTPDAK